MQEVVEKILKTHNCAASSLLAVLQDIQDEFNYLPREALEQVAKDMKVPMSRIASLSTFFTVFSLKPRGKNVCDVCMGTACYARGADKLVDHMKRQLEVEVGGTSTDKLFTLETVNCVGACALGPLVKVGKKYHGHMTASKLDRMLKQYRKSAEG